MPVWAWILLWLAVSGVVLYGIVWIIGVIYAFHLFRKAEREYDKMHSRFSHWGHGQ